MASRPPHPIAREHERDPRDVEALWPEREEPEGDPAWVLFWLALGGAICALAAVGAWYLVRTLIETLGR